MTEFLLPLRIEALEEGGYLATAEDLPGLVAQGWTSPDRGFRIAGHDDPAARAHWQDARYRL